MTYCMFLAKLVCRRNRLPWCNNWIWFLKVLTFYDVLFLKIYVLMFLKRFLKNCCLFRSNSSFTLSTIDRQASMLFSIVSRFGINIACGIRCSRIYRFILDVPSTDGEKKGDPFSPRDPRFEMLELVLLTLGFPFRLGLPGYYRLSGRFVMTPEAAILVLSAAHYRRGMTVVAFIFFLSLSLFSFLVCLLFLPRTSVLRMF